MLLIFTTCWLSECWNSDPLRVPVVSFGRSTEIIIFFFIKKISDLYTTHLRLIAKSDTTPNSRIRPLRKPTSVKKILFTFENVSFRKYKNDWVVLCLVRPSHNAWGSRDGRGLIRRNVCILIDRSSSIVRMLNIMENSVESASEFESV